MGQVLHRAHRSPQSAISPGLASDNNSTTSVGEPAAGLRLRGV